MRFVQVENCDGIPPKIIGARVISATNDSDIMYKENVNSWM